MFHRTVSGFHVLTLAWLVGLTAVGGVGAAAVVDEPQGARTNHGGTLWHYRRNPRVIREFHTFLRNQDLSPRDVLPDDALRPPEKLFRILIEPEQLPAFPKAPWRVAKWPEASGGGGLAAVQRATGAYISVPIDVPAARTYRLWVRYYAFADVLGIFGLQIYPTDREEPVAILDVLANERPLKEAGWRWASYLVDLPAEVVELRIVHTSAHNEAPGPRADRRLDCVYLTTECWREAPPLALLEQIAGTGSTSDRPFVKSAPRDQALRTAHAFHRAALETARIQHLPFGQGKQDRDDWAWWMARPADWESARQYPKLFDVSYRFWRDKLGQLAETSHEPLPDYRDPSRQIVFDDHWNLVGNPVMVARQVKRMIASYPKPGGSDHHYHWLEVEDFEHADSGWQRTSRAGNSVRCLRPRSNEVAAGARQRIHIDRPGRYAVWVLKGMLGRSYAPLRVRVTGEDTPPMEKKLLGGDDPSDHGADWSWHKIGIVGARAGEMLELEVHSVPRSQLASKVKHAREAPPKVRPGMFYRWIEAEQMEAIAFDWDVTSRSGNSADHCIGLGVDPTGGAGYAGQEVAVDQPGEYYLWVRKGVDGNTYSPLRINMLSPRFGPPQRRSSQKEWWDQRRSDDYKADVELGTIVQENLDGNTYEPRPPGNWTWQRVGPLRVEQRGDIRIEVNRRHYPHFNGSRGALTPAIRKLMGAHHLDCVLLTNDADYTPSGIHDPTSSGVLYLRPAVDVMVVTDNLDWKPRRTERPVLNRREYLRRAEALGAAAGDGYLLWVDDPYGWWTDRDWPRDGIGDMGADRIRRVVPRDSVLAAAIRLRNLREEALRFEVRITPLENERGKSFDSKASWRVVANMAPAWTPIPLLRRPGITLPPYHPACIWLTLDARGLEPGTYRGAVVLASLDDLPARRVPVELHVAPHAATPRRPILVGGYGRPFPGLVYKQDFKDHGMTLSRARFANRAERRRWGVLMTEYPLGEFGPKRDGPLRRQFRHVLEHMRDQKMGFGECLWKIGDEPSGTADVFAYDGKVMLEMEPRARILYNPGPRAGLNTFEALDPHVAVWEPHLKHLRFPRRAALITAKPYMWYDVYSTNEWSTRLPGRIYTQIRSVPARPGNCIGTKFYTVRATERFPWDTAHQMIAFHEGLFMYPTPHGPVPSRGWEAVRDAAQHADLAVLLEEIVAERGLSGKYAGVAGEGSIEQLLAALAELTSNRPKAPGAL